MVHYVLNRLGVHFSSKVLSIQSLSDLHICRIACKTASAFKKPLCDAQNSDGKEEGCQGEKNLNLIIKLHLYIPYTEEVVKQ